MPLAVAAHNSMLDDFAGGATTLGVQLCTTLSADVSSGATSVDVDNPVGVDDEVALALGGSSEDIRTVTAVSGTGPYTATLDAALGNAHNAGANVAHAPKAGGEVREPSGGSPSYSRQGISWNAASGESVTSFNDPVFDVPSGTAAGSSVYYDGSSVFLGSSLFDAVEDLGSQGTITVTSAQASLAAE